MRPSMAFNGMLLEMKNMHLHTVSIHLFLLVKYRITYVPNHSSICTDLGKMLCL